MRMMEGHSVERREGDVETLQRRAHGIVSRNLCQFFGMANCHFNAIHDWSLSVFVFRSKAQRIKRPKVAKLAFFHVSSQGQFYICRMQGSSGLHESDTNQDKVQGIFLMFMRKSQVLMAFSLVHLLTEKGAYWLVLTSFNFFELSWTHGSYMKFWIRWTYALCAFENFLGTWLVAHTKLHPMTWVLGVCNDIEGCCPMWRNLGPSYRPGWKGPRQIQQVFPILESRDFLDRCPCSM